MATPDFTKMVPGFDFLQNLLKGAGGGLPAMSQWIAPTLDAEEVDKRIQELRTVQFWLEQNAKMLAATIQALEVQRMTLATLKTMNLPVSELRESLKIDPAAFMPRTRTEEPAAPPRAPRRAPEPPAAEERTEPAAEPPKSGGAAIDPMQWWGALTRQFTELAANAIKDTPVQAATEAATQMAGAAFQQAVKPMADAAKAMTGTAPARKPAAPAKKAAGKTAAAKKATAARKTARSR